MKVLSGSTILALILTLMCGISLRAHPQQNDQQQDLQINLADKAIPDLSALVRWLADEKGMQITTNSATFPANVNNKVVFYGDVRVSPDSMLEVVQSILRSNGFALVKSDVANLYQIVELPEVRPFTPLVAPGEEGNFGPAEYITGVFPLTHINQQDALNYVKQMLYGNANEQAASNITAITNRNVLVITETSIRLAKIYALLRQIDIPGQLTVRKFYQVKNLQAQELQQQLEGILSAQPQGSTNDPQQAAQLPGQPIPLKINAVLRTNQLLLSGTEAQIEEALKIIKELDVEDQLELTTYKFRNVSAKRIDNLVRQTLSGIDEKKLERLYKSSVVEQSNELIATTRKEIHARISALKRQLDVVSSASDAQSPMRFYELRNVKATDILDTLQSVERRFRNRRAQNARVNDRLGSINYRDGYRTSGNRGIQNPSTNSFDRNSTLLDPFFDVRNRDESLVTRDELLAPDLGGEIFGDSVVGDIARLATGTGQRDRVIPGEAKVTVDENTNTLIVVAEPAIQQLYKQLIERLDVRRPQVLVEVTVVATADEDIYDLGIEVSGGDRTGGRRLFAFSSYGLSTVDAATGALSIIPGLGFNGTLIDPETADVVIRALATHSKARVISAPRILVNDNSTGLLSSVEERAFTGINAGNTVSTTSVAGFTQAGTTITVTPQISDDDYLNLDFDILVNNFVGAGTAELPAPIKTDQVTSDVSIPDGHTVIVGGLTRQRNANQLLGFPFIERIPIINFLTSRETDEFAKERLFVFIKPTILRDDKYKDLLYLSEHERKAACIPGDLPKSSPVLIR